MKGIRKRVRSRKDATPSALSHPAETLPICICLRNAKGISRNTDVSGKERLCSSGRKIGYREFSSEFSKTLFSIVEGSFNSKSCQVHLGIICS